MLHVIALGTAVDHEPVADHLHKLRIELLGQAFAGLLCGQTGTVEHGALDELAPFDDVIRLLDGVLASNRLACGCHTG